LRRSLRGCNVLALTLALALALAPILALPPSPAPRSSASAFPPSPCRPALCPLHRVMVTEKRRRWCVTDAPPSLPIARFVEVISANLSPVKSPVIPHGHGHGSGPILVKPTKAVASVPPASSAVALKKPRPRTGKYTCHHPHHSPQERVGRVLFCPSCHPPLETPGPAPAPPPCVNAPLHAESTPLHAASGPLTLHAGLIPPTSARCVDAPSPCICTCACVSAR
jgi:hypothetical protein